MNSLSWFLYWIDVLNSLNSVLVTASVLLMLSLIATWIFCSIAISDEHDTKTKSTLRQSRREWSWRFTLIAIACAVIACFMPSKNTMYAIAASQAGEQIVKSEAVQGMATDAQKALQQWIKRQIEPIPVEAKSK